MSETRIDLVAERLNRGMSRRQMAKEIGVSEAVLRSAEQGGHPHPSNALKIASYYGVLVTNIWPVENEEPAAA